MERVLVIRLVWIWGVPGEFTVADEYSMFELRNESALLAGWS